MRRVVAHDDNGDDIVTIDPITGRTVPAIRDDLVVYEINLDAVNGAIADAIELRGEPERLEHHLWRLGDFVPMEGERFSAFLVISHEPHETLAITARASSFTARPFILITPTRRHVGDACFRLLRDRQSVHLTLEDTVRMPRPGSVALRRPLRVLLRGFLEQHAPASVNVAPVHRFPTPAGATWADVSIRFTDGHTVSISVRGATKRCTYEDMGMGRKRSKRPTIQWDLLQAFAREHGVLTWSNSAASRQNQKRRERLADALEAFFGIAGDPFEYDATLGGWRARFRIEPD